MSRPRSQDLEPERVREALEAGHGRWCDFEGVRYFRFSGRGGVERGTVHLADGRTLPPYPSVGRIFVLEAGVRRNLRGPFVAEEKIDGYNVRIARCDDGLLAFTRSGAVCPFTVDRLPDLAALEPLFDEDPDLVLCVEIAGPENPYIHGQVPHVEEDVALFAFDLLHLRRPGTLPVEERDALFERFGLPTVPRLGRFDADGDLAPLREALLELDAQGSEGVLLKPVGSGEPVKYVTPAVNLADVVEDASLLAELPSEFFSSRIVRLAIGLEELGLEDRIPEMAERLGSALLEDFEATLHRFHETGVAGEVFRMRMHREDRIDALFRHLKTQSKRVNVRELSRERDGEMWRVEFLKIFQRSTGWLHTVLDGAAIHD